MLRRLFTAASLVSLLLCVMAITLSVRSYRFYDAGPFLPNGTLLQFDSLNGEFALTWHTYPSHVRRPTHVIGATTEFVREQFNRRDLWFDLEEWWENQGSPRWLHMSILEPPPEHRPFWHLERLADSDLARTTLGIKFIQRDYAFEQLTSLPVIMRFYMVILPYWLVIALLGVLPVMRFVAWQRGRKRIARGQCPQCGYDCRASKDRCPECGTRIPTKQGSASLSN